MAKLRVGLLLLSSVALALSTPALAQTGTATATATAFDSRLQRAEWDHGDAVHMARLAGLAERRAEVEAAAAAGNLDAKTLAGVAWFAGSWGAIDNAKATALILEAANGGQARAMSIAGILLWEGTTTTKDEAGGLKWLQQAADADNGVAQGYLAVLIQRGRAAARGGENPIQLLEKAADKGIGWAANALGNAYFDGVGVAKNDALARKYFERAALLGDTYGLAAAGIVAWTAEREPMDSKFQGFAKMELAARSGQVDAAKVVAGTYLGNTIHLDLANPSAALTLLEGLKAAGSKDADINKMLPNAKAAVAREQAAKQGGAFGIGFGLGRSRSNSAPTPRVLTSKEIVDGIKIAFPAWPAGVPDPVLPSIRGDRSPVDEYGVSEREWREMSAEQFTGFVMMPTVLKRVADGYAARDPKALTLIAMVARATNASLTFAENYPQCQKDAGRPDYCNGLADRLREYLTATGIGFWSTDRAGQRSGHLYTEAIADYLIGRPSMRAQLEGALKYGTYNDQQRGRMLVFADLGYLPAIQYLEDKSGACGGSSDDVRFLARHGRSQRKFVDAAMALGDAATGFEYAKQLRGGFCVGRDPEGAAKLFRAAADLGHLDAKYALMEMYAGYTPGNFSPRYGEALRLVKEIEAESGYPVKPELVAQIREHAKVEAEVRGAIGFVNDDPSKAPNAATIRAVVMREQRWLVTNFSGLSFMSLISNPPVESWNYDDGSFLFETQNPNDMFGIYYLTNYYIGGASCTPAPGGARAYDCSYSMSADLDYRIGKLTLFKGSSGAAKRQKHRFEFVGGEWRSPSLRAEMMANMPTNGIGASDGGNKNGLCKSLYAGVVAVGGKSTDKSLDPSTWGC
jgi:TPR repeat protein